MLLIKMFISYKETLILQNICTVNYANIHQMCDGKIDKLKLFFWRWCPMTASNKLVACWWQYIEPILLLNVSLQMLMILK
jgi:hypothetical protein